MLKYIKRFFRERRARREFAEHIAPATIKALASDLRELAVLAARSGSHQVLPYERIQRMQTELDQLLDLATRPEFTRLSVQQRLELHAGLLHSKDLLMECIQTVAVPTERLQ